MVVVELGQETHGKLEQPARRAGPDRRAQRHQIVIDEVLRVTVLLYEFRERRVGGGSIEQSRGLAIESNDLEQHPVEARLQQVGSLCKQAAERSRAVLQAAVVAVDAEAHRRRLRRHAELAHQLDEVRIGVIVEDDEAGVDGMADAIQLDVDGVSVAADIVVRFEERDVVVRL